MFVGIGQSHPAELNQHARREKDRVNYAFDQALELLEEKSQHLRTIMDNACKAPVCGDGKSTVK